MEFERRNQMRKAVVVQTNSPFFNVVGMSSEPNFVGNVMFYPEDPKVCYRTCLKKEDVRFLGSE